MPTVPCSGAQNCLDVESPVSNLSSEGPDVAKCFRYSFGPQSQSVCEFDLSLCSAFAAVGADVGILCDPPFGPPGGPNPPPPVIYSSSAQSCTVDCGGFSETYSVAPGTFVALSQADANSAAANFACELAALQCTGPVTTFTNTPQSCTGTCANGDSITYTTPAGFFTALSQSEANVNAFLFACEVAALLCAEAPPVGTFPGAGTERQDPTNPLYGNFEQSCTSVCPDGSIYSHTIAAGTYTSESRAAANAIANSAACVLANSFRFCLSELPATACVGEFFFETLQADANFTTTFSLVSGALPDGLVLTSQGFIQGVPSAPGSFTFTIRATNPENGNSTQRAYTMNAIEITPSFLPDGTTGVPYAEALSVAGLTGSETWTLTFGDLPDGLTLNPFTGLISGTPTVPGVYPFTVSVTDGEATCSKNYSIEVPASATDMQYWDYEESSGTRFDSVQNAPMVPALVGAATINRVAGKVNFGVQLLISGASTARLQQTGGTGFPFAIADGMTMCGWVNITAIAPDGMMFGFHSGLTPHGFETDKGIVEAAGDWYLFEEPGGFTLITTPPFGSWVFFVLELMTDGTMRIELDRTAVFESVAVTQFPEGTNITLVLEMGDTVSGDWAFDEIGFFPMILTDPQKDFIFNGGAGRAYPFVLP